MTADKPSGSPVLPIDLLGNLRRHWLLAASVFVLVMTAGTAVAFRLNKPSYYAESIVYVSPDVPQLLGGDTQIVQPYDSYVDDEAHTVTRYDIIADSIAKLPESIRHRTGPPTPAEVTALQKLLEVSRIGSTFQISIGLHGRKPDNLAGIVNTVTQTFLEDTNDQDFNGRDARLKTLKDDQQQLQSEISGKTAEQMQLMQKLGVATLAAGEGAANPFDAGLETLHTELAAAQMQREAAQAAWISAIGGSGSGQSVALDTAADEAAAQDPGLSSLRTSLNARKAALIAEMSTLTPNHPVYKQDKDELARINAQLQQRIAGVEREAAEHIQETLYSNLQRTRTMEQQLEGQVAAKTQMAAQAAPEIELASQLGAEIKGLQANVAIVNQRIRDLQLESSSPHSIHLFSAARPPVAPEKGKFRLMLAISLFGSIVFAAGSVCFDTRVYNSSDIQRVLGFHPVGLLLNRDEFSNEIQEQYLFRLSAGIDHAIRESGARTFVFTSIQPGGGTSTVVQALSRELAALNWRVLTILASEDDEPVVCSKQPPELILEAATDAPEMESASEKPLEIAGAGVRTRSTRSGKEPAAVARVLQNAAASYDAVLIDAEPLMISADTEYLARNTDVTVLVVESCNTVRRDLSHAARLLERISVAAVAVVLNKVSAENADSELRHSLRAYRKAFSHGGHSSIPQRTLRRREADAQQQGNDIEHAETSGGEAVDEVDCTVIS